MPPWNPVIDTAASLHVGVSAPTSGNAEDTGPLMSLGWDPRLVSSQLLGDTPPDHDITRGGFWGKPIRGLSCLKISGEGLGSGTPDQCLKREPSLAGAHVCRGPVLRSCQAG